MLREETEFIGNAIGIDPAGCGCTDCIVGNSMPEDDYKIEELIKAHLEEGREVVNRANGTIIMYKTGYGTYNMDIIGSSQVTLIPETPSWENRDEYKKVLHRAYCECDDCTVYRESIPVSDEILAGYAVRNHLENGDELFNATGCTLLVYKVWDESYVVEELDLSSDGQSISIITYD